MPGSHEMAPEIIEEVRCSLRDKGRLTVVGDEIVSWSRNTILVTLLVAKRQGL
jgi:hypothetical protein